MTAGMVVVLYLFVTTGKMFVMTCKHVYIIFIFTFIFILYVYFIAYALLTISISMIYGM
jgi:hypothetical protein